MGSHSWVETVQDAPHTAIKAGGYGHASILAEWLKRVEGSAELRNAERLRARKTRRLMRLQSLVDHASLQQGVQKHQVKGPVAGVAKLKLRRLLQEQQAELQALRDQRP
jgi:hypothetical protein